MQTSDQTRVLVQRTSMSYGRNIPSATVIACDQFNNVALMTIGYNIR